MRIITGARRYIYIQTPYFPPTESLAEALYSAAVSGVDVRLMVSARSDTRYVDPAARSYYEDLLAAGMRIYEHPAKFIHAKTMVADDYISMIGSTNMDFRSFEASFEMNCYLYDPDLAARNKAIFLQDMAECREVLLDEWERRPCPQTVRGVIHAPLRAIDVRGIRGHGAHRVLTWVRHKNEPLSNPQA